MYCLWSPRTALVILNKHAQWLLVVMWQCTVRAGTQWWPNTPFIFQGGCFVMIEWLGEISFGSNMANTQKYDKSQKFRKAFDFFPVFFFHIYGRLVWIYVSRFFLENTNFPQFTVRDYLCHFMPHTYMCMYAHTVYLAVVHINLLLIYGETLWKFGWYATFLRKWYAIIVVLDDGFG